jgi:hypothetical protein
MIPPPRLAEEGTLFEREVLASSRLDVGSDQGLQRTLVAMGVGAAAISATTSTTGAGVAAGGAANAAASGGGVAVVVKWIGVAVVVAGSATAASVHGLGHEDRTAAVSSPSRPAIVRPSVPERERVPSFSALSNSLPELAPTAEPLAASVVPPVLGAASQRASVAAATAATHMEVASAALPSETPAASSAPAVDLRPPSSLDAEIATLDGVRALLARRDGRGALEALEAYDRAFPASVLAEEATVLRVDASMVQGDRAAAAALSRRFLAAHPSSPHARHLRQVIDFAHNP